MIRISCKQAVMGAGLLCSAVLVSGCGFTEPQRVEHDFGNSVRQMISAQTLNPTVVADPDREPVKELDGIKAEKVLQSYREEAPPPAPVNIINIGTAGGQ